MAAVMLAGAPLCNEAFAVTTVTAKAWASVDADAKIANGVKFVIKDAAGNYYTVATGVADASGKEYTTVASSATTTAATASVFEVRNFSKTAAGNTFELYVDGKPLSVDANGSAITATTETKNVETLFTADSDKLSAVTAIKLAKVGTATTVISVNSLDILSATIEADDLNANLSGQGFKLNFPTAASQPDVNPFAGQMIAVKASKVATTFGITPAVTLSDEVCFVVADEAGKKLLNPSATADDFKAASFVIVDPVNNFGITGLNFDDAAGQGFTTVKGSSLSNTNAPKSATDKTIDKYAFGNGVFSVSASDYINAEEEYAISADVLTFKDGSSASATKAVNIGAYSLMDGGLKTFITTVPTASTKLVDKLAPATTGGNTYAVAADLLKADAPAVYNIFFAGDKTAAGTATSAYGKYLTNTAVVAPKDAALDNLTAQWVVTSIDAKGNVRLVNAYDKSKTFTAKLYKTDEEGTFQANSPVNTLISGKTGTDKIVLTPATDNATFLTLSEEQLKQQVTLSFTDDQVVNVEDLYMVKDAKTDAVTPNKDASKAFAWNVEAVATVNNIIAYAYLKNNEVVTAPDTVKVQTYYLYTEELNTAGKVVVKGLTTTAPSPATYTAALTGATAGTAPTAVEKINAWKQFAFVKDGDSYKMLTVTHTGTPAKPIYTYTSDVLNAQRTYADVKTSEFASAPTGATTSFDHVNLNFESVSVAETSLEKAPRYATFESFYGAVSMAEENGIMQGIVSADAMTFWLDTVTVKDEPTFYISKGIAKKEETKAVEAGSVRNFLYMPADSAYYWDASSAKYVSDKKYTVDGTEWLPTSGSDLKAIFRPGALAENNTKFNTVAGGKEVEVTKDNGLGNFQFNIFKLDADDENYVIYNAAHKAYVYNLNGVLAFTSIKDKALRSTIGEGVVTVKGAAGKQVVVSNILGQVIANKVATSDEETIAVAAGVAVVVVDGEATKVVVK